VNAIEAANVNIHVALEKTTSGQLPFLGSTETDRCLEGNAGRSDVIWHKQTRKKSFP
jgi:hypothetical protein